MYQLFYVKSNYSLLSSLLTIDDIIAYQKARKSTSAVLCDDTMYGTMEFIEKCHKERIRPIIGLEMTVENDIILGFAKNYGGYQNMMKLSTLQNTKKITLEELIKHKEDIIFILPFSSHSLYASLEQKLSTLYLGYKNLEEEALALKVTKNIVFLPMCLYKEEKEQESLKYLYMIRDGKTIADEVVYDVVDKALLLDDVITRSHNEGLIRSTLLAEECQLELPQPRLLLPRYETPKGVEAKTYLEELSKAGLKKRLNQNVSENYQQRLFYELNVINQMGFANYFLIVYDFIKYAKKKEILVGPGRGSAAGSLVAYALGITEIDPLRYDLLFERFLNPERISMPDIDTDLPDAYREEVIDYVMTKYGKDHVAGIVTFATLAAKQVIRDIGRVLNIPLYKLDKLTSYIPAMSKEKLSTFYTKNPQFQSYIESEKSLQKLYQIALKLEGFPRQIGTHAAGIVMSEEKLEDILPLTISDSFYLTSYSMNYLEPLGLLKMDFLGLKNLTLIMHILKDIELRYGEKIDFEQISLDDKEVFHLFSEAQTSGIFQFESVGMRNFLRKLKPATLEDIIAAIALFRPGPAANIDTYIARKEGKEAVVYPDASLVPVLKNTYGIMIYQEQIMQVASLYAGYSLGEADILRRAISKKKLDVLQQEEAKFLQKTKQLGKEEATSKALFALIMKFAGYGFNRSHAVAYSLVAYKMAYLKVHYQPEFYAALLSNVLGSETKTREYIMEVRSQNLCLVKPNINLSQDRFIVTKAGILFPFASIKGIGTTVCKTILEARKEEPFKDLFDAFSRLMIQKVTRKQLETLVLAGCFETFGYNKRTLIENMDALINYAELTKDLDPSLVLLPELEQQEEYNNITLLEQEKASFGFYISNHPTTVYQKEITGVCPLEKITNYYNKTVSVFVMIEKIKVITTKKEEKMAFLSGSDESRLLDFTLFPKTYNQYKNLQKGDLCVVTGTVEKRLNQTQMIVRTIKVVKGGSNEETEMADFER